MYIITILKSSVLNRRNISKNTLKSQTKKTLFPNSSAFWESTLRNLFLQNQSYHPLQPAPIIYQNITAISVYFIRVMVLWIQDLSDMVCGID